jgi:hypothetical protein
MADTYAMMHILLEARNTLDIQIEYGVVLLQRWTLRRKMPSVPGECKYRGMRQVSIHLQLLLVPRLQNGESESLRSTRTLTDVTPEQGRHLVGP